MQQRKLFRSSIDFRNAKRISSALSRETISMSALYQLAFLHQRGKTWQAYFLEEWHRLTVVALQAQMDTFPSCRPGALCAQQYSIEKAIACTVQPYQVAVKTPIVANLQHLRLTSSTYSLSDGATFSGIGSLADPKTGNFFHTTD